MTPDAIRLALSAMPARVAHALTVYAEASGEPDTGQIAVAWVIKQRAARWRMSVQRVCLQPHQFSCWWGDDANSRRLFAMAEAILTGALPREAGWLQTAALAHRVLLGAIPDPTGGATFYCADHILTDPARRDEWFPKAVRSKKLIETARIGGHVFFSEAIH